MTPMEALRRTLWAVVWLSAPLLLTVVVAAVVVGWGQSLVRLRDGSLPQVARLVAGLVAVLALGGWMAAHLLRFATAMLSAAVRVG